MKAPFLAAVALVALTFAGVAQAGPTSTLYLTYTFFGGDYQSVVVQGNSITAFPEVYSRAETPIAVWGDVRTTGYSNNNILHNQGGQYALGGTPTGTSYVLPSVIGGDDGAYDSTSDGTHNYLVDYSNGTVYQTDRDFTNPVALFNTVGPYNPGITYDAANNSLWISGGGSTTVTDYSLSGALLSSFSTGHDQNYALALDPADHTLWLFDGDYRTSTNFGYLEQYSTAGVLLSVGPYLGYTNGGGEFDLAPTTPEPGTLILFGSGILGLARMLRRKINL